MTETASPSPDTTHRPQELVLLGDGQAHLEVLAQLAERPLAGTVVTLITPHTQHVVTHMVPGYVAGLYDLAHCVVPLQALVQRSGVRWLQGNVTTLDSKAQCIALDGDRTIRFDWLSINTDLVQDREAVEKALPGATEHALFTRPVEAFISLWPRVVAMAATRPLRIAVIAGGASGFQLALAVRHRLPHCSVTLICGDQLPGAKQSPAIALRMQTLLKQRGVTVLQDVVVGMNGESVQLGCGADLACDVPLLGTSLQAPAWMEASGLVLNEAGSVAVDQFHRATSHGRVFATQDTGDTLAFNLKAAAAGFAPKAASEPSLGFRVLACGNRYAIGRWKQFTFGGWWLWQLKAWADRRMVARYSHG